MKLNRDCFTAMVFLALSVALFIATYYLPPPMFNQLAASTWPRLILIPLAILSVILLIQSQLSDEEPSNPMAGVLEWVSDNRRPFMCFALFFGFLVSMPVLGMLLGGMLYVFLTLSVLGGWTRGRLIQNAAIASISVIGMWFVFNVMLGVLLPEGTILRLN